MVAAVVAAVHPAALVARFLAVAVVAVRLAGDSGSADDAKGDAGRRRVGGGRSCGRSPGRPWRRRGRPSGRWRCRTGQASKMVTPTDAVYFRSNPARVSRCVQRGDPAACYKEAIPPKADEAVGVRTTVLGPFPGIAGRSEPSLCERRNIPKPEIGGRSVNAAASSRANVGNWMITGRNIGTRSRPTPDSG